MSANRQGEKMVCRGLDLVHPVDLMKPSGFPLLSNVRAYQDGRIEARPGQTAINAVAITGAPTVHSIRRLNDETSGSSLFARIVGAGTSLYFGTTSFAKVTSPFTVTPDIADSFSGNPLAMMPFRPDQSPQPWMYVGDTAKFVKVRQDGRAYIAGILPPLEPPSAVIGQPVYKTLDRLNSATGWTVDGTIFTAVAASANRVNTTITAILYDSGTTGLAMLQPAAATGIESGVILDINAAGGTAEAIIVESTHPAITDTTISSIKYDSGTTGLCAIQPVAPVEHLKVNTFILLNSGGGTAERVRVISVTRSKRNNRIKSFRCSTVNNHVATETLTGVYAFRAFFANNHVATETVQTDALRFTVSSTRGTGIGLKALTVNMAQIGSRSTEDDDEIHMSVRISDMTDVVEMKIIFNVDTAVALVSVPFEGNHFFYSFRPSDIQVAVDGTLTVLSARQRLTQRQILERRQRRRERNIPGPPIDVDDPRIGAGDASLGGIDEDSPISGQIGSGDDQWFEVRFKVKDLTRVGGDTSRTLANVRDIQIIAKTTNSCTIDVNALWLGGSSGPDSGAIGEDYMYRYRGRNTETGAKSNPSPPMRSGIRPRRQSVVVTVTQMRAAEHPSWAQVDVIDIERFGGALGEWHFIGTATNTSSVAAGSTTTFTDTLQDDVAVGNVALETDVDMPFTVPDLPKSGVCDVTGTTVTQTSGDTFSTSWAPGTLIEIDGVIYTLYNRPRSTTVLEIIESAETLTGVTWRVYEPKLLGQGLPVLWGPTPEGFMFACGDSKNPGRLYWTNGNNPDGAAESNWREVTSPSEPLINGFVYNGRAFIFSSERMFVILPNFGSPNLFDVLDVPNSKGLISRWAFAVGPLVWFVSKDGVYTTAGGPPVPISIDLYPLFPHDGQAGVATNGINPPDYATQTASFRLAYYDSLVYFDFIDTAEARRTLIYSTLIGGWFYDSYGKPVVMHYGEEGSGVHILVAGSTDGVVYQASGTSDGGTAISCQLRTPSIDLGDPRVKKLWGDTHLDLDRDGATITVVQGFDQHSTTLVEQTISTGSGRQRYQLQTVSGAGQDGYNASLDITWSSTTAVPKLFYYEWHFEPYPGELLAWQTIALTHGLTGFQHLRDAFIGLISSDTVTLTVNVDGVAFTYTIASTGSAHRKTYVPFQVMKGKVFSYRLSSPAVFRFFPDESECRVKPWGSNEAYRSVNPFGQVSLSTRDVSLVRGQ